MIQTIFTRSIILSFFILVSFSICPAQQLANSRKSSYYTYIFKLDPGDVKEMEKNDQHNHARYCKTPAVDSFPTDSVFRRKLPHGYYFFTTVQGMEVIYKMDLYTDLLAKIAGRNDRDVLILTDKNGIPQRDATVLLEKKKVSFDERTQSFPLPKNQKSCLITIRSGDETIYYSYVSMGSPKTHRWIKVLTHPVYTIKRTVNRRTGKDQFSGYMAFNKPKYLPGDTVKMKAFLVKSSGKPLTQTLSLSIRLTDRSQKKNTCGIKSVEQGKLYI